LAITLTTGTLYADEKTLKANPLMGRLGVDAALRIGGHYPFPASAGVRVPMRLYMPFANWLSYGVELGVFTPLADGSLYGYKISGYDFVTAARPCFTASFIDFCPGFGWSTVAVSVGQGAKVGWGAYFISIGMDFHFPISHMLNFHLGMEGGYYTNNGSLTIDNRPDQQWKPSPGFGILTVGLSYNLRQEIDRP
jgi:hypothetical protein